MLKTLLFTLFVISQMEGSVEEPTQDVPVTNEGQTFEDPFAEGEEPEGSPGEAAAPEEAGSTADEMPSESSPESSGEIVFPDEEAAPSPMGEEATEELSTEEDYEEVEEYQEEELPESEAEQEQPAREFEFPELDRPGGPITQDLAEKSVARSRTKKGAWSIMALGGAGIKLNRRPQQVHTEIAGMYRLWDRGDLGLTVSARFVDDFLLGLIATNRWYFRVTDPDSTRIELALMSGLGWTFRQTAGKFREGRGTARLGLDGFFYFTPTISLASTLSVESHLFSVSSDGEFVSLFKETPDGSGPPSQLILAVGVRWDF